MKISQHRNHAEMELYVQAMAWRQHNMAADLVTRGVFAMKGNTQIVQEDNIVPK